MELNQSNESWAAAMRLPSERQLLTAGSWVLATLSAYLVIASAPSDPPDLAQFYLGGQLVLQGQVADLYNPLAYEPLVQQLLDSGARVAPWHFFNRPAFAVLPWAALAALPYQLVVQFSLISNLIGIALLAWKLPAWFPSLKNYRAWLVCYPPFLWGLLMGQDTVFLTLILAYSLVLIRGGRETSAGLLLSLCVVKPHLVWLVPVALFFTGKRRAAWSFVAGGAVLAGVSLAMVGFSGFLEWRELLNSPTTDFTPEGMTTLRAIGLQTHIGVAILLAVGVIVALYQACQSKSIERAVPVAIVASLLLSPHAYAQDASTFAVVAGFAAGPLARAWLLLPWPALVSVFGVNAFVITYAVVGVGAILALSIAGAKPLDTPTPAVKEGLQ